MKVSDLMNFLAAQKPEADVLLCNAEDDFLRPVLTECDHELAGQMAKEQNPEAVILFVSYA